MPHQPRLHMLFAQRLFEQRIVVQIGLPKRKVIGGAPPRVDLAKIFRRQCILTGLWHSPDLCLPRAVKAAYLWSPETIVRFSERSFHNLVVFFGFGVSHDTVHSTRTKVVWPGSCAFWESARPLAARCSNSR